MLIEFSVTNFLSFKEKTTFSMVASSDKSLKDNYVNFDNEKLLLMTAIYGANASGKSNLFKVLNLVGGMIAQSNFINPNNLLPIIPFKFDKKTINEPSEFEIKFLIEGIRYVYGFKADVKNIYNEYLIYYPNGRPVKIFNRENINDYTFNSSDDRFLRDVKEKNTPNKFFLTTATTWNYEKTKPVFEFLTEKMGVVMSFENVKAYSYNRYYKDEDKTLKTFALKFLEQADFSIKEYTVIQENLTDDQINSIPDFVRPFFLNNSSVFKVNTTHVANGEKYELDIFEESLGTQAIFTFIPVLKDVIDNGKIIFIDEFDKSLHPQIVQYIVEMFNNPEINKKNAQLIFNTHDTNLLNLDLLRRDQIWFTEKKSDTGVSSLYALDDYPVRKTENVEKGYLLGRYGAIPFIMNNFDEFIE